MIWLNMSFACEILNVGLTVRVEYIVGRNSKLENSQNASHYVDRNYETPYCCSCIWLKPVSAKWLQFACLWSFIFILPFSGDTLSTLDRKRVYQKDLPIFVERFTYALLPLILLFRNFFQANTNDMISLKIYSFTVKF